MWASRRSSIMDRSRGHDATGHFQLGNRELISRKLSRSKHCATTSGNITSFLTLQKAVQVEALSQHQQPMSYPSDS